MKANYLLLAIISVVFILILIASKKSEYYIEISTLERRIEVTYIYGFLKTKHQANSLSEKEKSGLKIKFDEYWLKEGEGYGGLSTFDFYFKASSAFLQKKRVIIYTFVDLNLEISRIENVRPLFIKLKGELNEIHNKIVLILESNKESEVRSFVNYLSEEYNRIEKIINESAVEI